MLTQAPFIKVLIPIIAGILCFSFFPHPNYWFLSLATLGILFFGLCIYNRQKDTIRIQYNFLKGGLLLCSWFVFGYWISGVRHLPFNVNWYGHSIKQTTHYKAVILNVPEEKEKTIKVEVDIIGELSQGILQPVEGKSILYLKKEPSAFSLRQGQQLLIRNKLKPIQTAKNPGAFDYATYCKRQGVYHSAFLQEYDWTLIKAQQIKSWRSITALGSQFVKKLLKKYIHGQEELGIAEALLIGYRLDIDQALWQAYTNTGIVHIIAISGMHMAMIYQSMVWLLTCVPFFRKNRKTAIVIALVFMWLFAIITGLPASVLRSAIMFTCIGVGELFKRQMSIYNNMAVSAFILLCMNPNWLFDVGFQLSYLAVLSIVIFYPWIYDRITFKHRVPDFFWQLAAGTLAAQILSFPICIYYFHQFPVLFLFMNLIAIPLTTISLFAEILLVLFFWIHPLASFLGALSYYMIHYLNKIVFAVEKFSFAVWQYLSIHLLQVFLLYLLIASIAFFVQTRKKVYSNLAYLTAILFVSISTYSKYIHLSQRKIAIVNNGVNTSIAYVLGNKYHMYSKDTFTSRQEQYVKKALKVAWQINHEDSTIVQRIQNPFYHLALFQNQSVLVLYDHHYKPEKPIQVDLLIVAGRNPLPVDSLEAHFRYKRLILDASIPFRKMGDYISKLQTSHVAFHSIANDGAFVLNL